MTLQKKLKEIFGYDCFRGNQQAIMEHAMNGSDSLVLMPTGGGKSLCFQLPALMLDGITIVISPLIALMQDQVTGLNELGIRANFYNSSLSYAEKQNTLEKMQKGELDLLYMAPEGLLSDGFLPRLSQMKIALFAIDEAHCVSQWGHDFRPEYLRLSEITAGFQCPVMALTATADPRTRLEIIEKLKLKNHKEFISSFDRPNITYRIDSKTSPVSQLLKFIKEEHDGDSGIVYCLSRAKVDKTAKALQDKGYRALPYHAGLSNEQRAENQNAFLREENIIMVATIAFGMGIDKPDIRFVAHLDLPSSMEAYYQETGRAGRDGLPANAWMVYGLQDVILRRFMIDSGEGALEYKRISARKLDDMLAFCETVSCRRQIILSYFGEESAPCGNCDTCLEPVESIDGTIAAQKFLSTVLRLQKQGQQFGSGHIIDILRGRDTEKILQYKHHTLSTFGLGEDMDEFHWKSIFRQLFVKGYIKIVEPYSTLSLSAKSPELLKGEVEFLIRNDVKTRKKRKKAKVKITKGTENFSATENDLLALVKEWRLNKARTKNVAPFVVFHDKALVNFVDAKPTTIEELEDIHGFGKKKIEQYGEELLQIIRDQK
jgi:ATP-dependent DNA helicase RecQ